MAKGVYIQEGDNIDYKNSGSAAIAYGDVLVLTARIGVAACAIPVNETGTVSIAGVYELPAETTTAFTVGEELYWDDTSGKLTATKAASGAIYAGIATEAKAQATAKCCVKL